MRNMRIHEFLSAAAPSMSFRDPCVVVGEGSAGFGAAKCCERRENLNVLNVLCLCSVIESAGFCLAMVT